jgi:hypothetical protein
MTDEQTEGHRYELISRQREIDRQTDGHTNGCMDEQTDRHKNIQTERHTVCIKIHTERHTGSHKKTYRKTDRR